MKNFKKSFFYQGALLFVLIAFFSSCLTSKKMDKFVADQYGDQIPAQDKKKKADITVTSGLAGADLVVTYKAPQPDGSFKTGKITIKNAEERTGIRFFQSWKSATSEYLDRYNAGITDMAKIFISKLVAEL